MIYNKHYIRLSGMDIVRSFSDAFEQPKEGDICVNEKGDRHFNLDLVTAEGLYRYRWDGKQIVNKTSDEIYNAEYRAMVAEREAKESLKKIDLDSIRSIREYIAKQKDCPVEIIEIEALAVSERKNIIKKEKE